MDNKTYITDFCKQVKSGAILEGDLIWYTDGIVKPANNFISCDIENYSKRGEIFTVWRKECL